MSQLIGKINYPAESVGFAVEYCSLFSEGSENLLVFRLINRSEKTVNAYRIEICCDEKIQKYSVERRNVEINNGDSSEEIEINIPADAEEGKIVVSTVIFDDLSHNETVATFPFASFDAISRVANSILSNKTSKTETLSCMPNSTLSGSSEAEDEMDCSQSDEESIEEIAKSDSPLPLILAILAVVSSILIFCLSDVLQIGGL